MIEPRLQRQLEALEKIRRKTRWSYRLALCCFAIASGIVVCFLLRLVAGWNVMPSGLTILLIGIAGPGWFWLRERRRPSDLAGLVKDLEREHPELHPLLSTALEQRPDLNSGRWGFLQRRVIDEVVMHPQRNLWQRELHQKLFVAQAVFVLALTVLVFSFSLLPTRFLERASQRRSRDKIIVEPGNIEIERGSSFVVTVRFNAAPPVEATLVMISAAGQTRRIPLERHLADPLFGASLRDISESSTYHIEYDDQKTESYAVKVFEYPALVRADATLHFPEFTGLTNKTIPDTLRISAVEGSRLSYNFQLNKAVAQAQLAGKESTLRLALGSNSVALLKNMVLINSSRYALRLVDADGRTNKNPLDLVIQVLPNRVPDLKLTFPRGDQRVSNVQELQLQAEATDDFGLVKYGFGFGVAGEAPKLVELGQSAAGNEKRQFNQLIALENLGLQVGQVVSYFAWADDYGPDGKVRRTFSDMFFAEVRPFDEVFRADQSGGSGNENQNQSQGQGGGNQSTRLTELQKQIVIATWKIQREKGGAAGVVKP